MTENAPHSDQSSGFGVNPMYDPETFTPNSANGQHILLDQAVLRRTAELIPIGENSFEIGAGPGTLTTNLLNRGGKVTAYEIDTRCEPMLERLAVETGHLAIKWQNFLDVTKEELEAVRPFHIVGNIPFQISEPLLLKLTDVRFKSAVLLVGQNLVKAMTAEHPDRKDSAFTRLSMITGGYFDVERIVEVPRDSFDPPPRVNAELVRLTRKDNTRKGRADAVALSYQALVKGIFTDSTAANALKSVVVKTDGTAETVHASKRSTDRRSGTRTIRRMNKMGLDKLRDDINTGHISRDDTNIPLTSLTMSSILADNNKVKALLDKPLFGLNNDEVRKLASGITSAVNYRTKRKPKY